MKKVVVLLFSLACIMVMVAMGIAVYGDQTINSNTDQEICYTQCDYEYSAFNTPLLIYQEIPSPMISDPLISEIPVSQIKPENSNLELDIYNYEIKYANLFELYHEDFDFSLNKIPTNSVIIPSTKNRYLLDNRPITNSNGGIGN